MNIKKTLVILLSVCMVMTSMPMTVWAGVNEPSEAQQETVTVVETEKTDFESAEADVSYTEESAESKEEVAAEEAPADNAEEEAAVEEAEEKTAEEADAEAEEKTEEIETDIEEESEEVAENMSDAEPAADEETAGTEEIKEAEKEIIIEEEDELASPSDAKEEDELASPSDAEKSEEKILEATAEDGMVVTMFCAEGAFEYNDIELVARLAKTAEEKEADKELEKETENDNIAKRVTYDICVMHNGEEIEPLDGEKVKVTFTLPDIPAGADAVNVYHHNDETDKVDTIVENGSVAEEVIGETDGFSLYTVDFTYNEKTISIHGDTDHNRLVDILAQIEISEAIEEAKAYQDADCTKLAADGIVKDAEGKELFKVYKEDNEWYVDAINAFSTEHGLLVKTENAEYKIMVTDEETIDVGNCLTFTAEKPNSTVKLDYYSCAELLYTTDGGANWIKALDKPTITLANIGDKVSFKGINVTTRAGTIGKGGAHFIMTGIIAASGDVTSLTNGSGSNAALSDYCYQGMFDGCASLTSAPSLPSSELALQCYRSMFSGCTGLTSAPELPATSLANECYFGMFSGCTGLTTAPKLSATTMKYECYKFMFFGCTGLTSAPELPATTLDTYCYESMFSGCTGLKSTPVLPAENLASYCYDGMFNGCTGLLAPADLSHVKSLAISACRYMYQNCSSIKVSADSDSDYHTEWKTPSDTTVDSWSFDMLSGTGGTFTGSPAVNTTYYLSAPCKEYTVKHMKENVDGTGYDVELATASGAVTCTVEAPRKDYVGFDKPDVKKVTIPVEGDPEEVEYYYRRNSYTVTIISSESTYGTISTSSVSGRYEAVIATQSETLNIGSTVITATPATDTAQYHYELVEWTGIPASGKLEGDVTITAEFAQTVREYAIIWKGGDGNIIQKDSVKYGATPSTPSTVPVKTNPSQYTFTWTNGWDKEIEAVTKAETYTATFTAKDKNTGKDVFAGADGEFGTEDDYYYDESGNEVYLNKKAVPEAVTSTAQSTTKGSSGSGGSGSSGGGGGGGSSDSAMTGQTQATYSKFWKQDATGNWKLYLPDGTMVRNSWVCDDAVTANGQNVWYFLDENGNLFVGGIVLDQNGYCYSFETAHNGYYGMLRYKDGTYDCNGNMIALTFNKNHDGHFASVDNPAMISMLESAYGGVTKVNMPSVEYVYTSTFEIQ